MTSEMKMPKTLCLNMIVKNERRAILRCLASVKPIITYWVIVDTGSTDGTQELIRNFMKDIPGELHERPWVDFAHNRNEALALAKGKAEYVFFIDADDILQIPDNFILPELDKDCYYIACIDQNAKCHKPLLVNNRLDWQWEGCLHEGIKIPDERTLGYLPYLEVNTNVCKDGSRTQDPKKYHKDAELLETALQKDPTNSRHQFYLAQCYQNAKEYQLALTHSKLFCASFRISWGRFGFARSILRADCASR